MSQPEEQNKTAELTLEALTTDVFEALGALSMCWSETPKGEFESTRAKEIGDALMIKITAYAYQQTASLQKEVDKWKGVARFENEECIKKAHRINELHGDISSLQKQVEELRELHEGRVSSIVKEKNRQLQEYHELIVQLEEALNDCLECEALEKTVTKYRKQNAILQAENAAANKRIDELTTKNLKLLNENNDLWDKVNNPKMKL